jgi:18S rRNA (adenine1779-N6/adenine1780-N6)-dimethyltransferase
MELAIYLRVECLWYFILISFSYLQIRLLFNRKNKTLRSVLMTKTTLQMLEDNRKTHKALQKKEDQMDDEDEEKSIKDIMEEILDRESWKGQRASKMDQDDFLQLLAEFNDAGIHFC